MKYNLTAATSIVIANMIGTGVFTSLGFQLLDLNNISSILILWLLGGIIAVLGSFCYAELSAAFPRSGGEYHFLRISFGNRIGFLSGWTSAVVGFAAPIAASAYAFAKYFSNVVDVKASPTVVAIAIVVIVTFIHSLKVNTGARFQVFFTIGKILLLIIFIAAGLMHTTKASPSLSLLPSHVDSADFSKAGFWIGLIFVSYAYSGWNASSYIIEDIKDPIKNVPRSIFLGTALVTIIYVLINYVFMQTAPIEEMKGKEDVGHIAAGYVFGPKGAVIVSSMISFFLVSTIGAMVIVGPRVIKRIAADYTQFNYFAQENKNGVPLRAILFQSGIAIFLLLTSSFEFIITAIGFILSIFTTLTAIGVLLLRYKNPDVQRSIKVPLFPITPLLFIFFNLWTMGYLILHRQKEVLAGVSFVAVGLIIYYLLSRKVSSVAKASIFIISPFFFMACQESSNKPLSDSVLQKRDSVSFSFKVNKTLDKRASQITGSDTTIFKDPRTVSVIQSLNNIWSQKNVDILEPIQKWVKNEMVYTPKPEDHTLVFYPFSGPDFEFANAFYPDADEYILCGLEKAGNLSSLIFTQEAPVDSFIQRAASYFYFSDRFGFFRTLDMQVHFKEKGVVDIISLYIKKAGGKMGEVSLYHWDRSKGRLITPDSLHQPDVCYFNFQFPSGKVSSLYYFEKDASDQALQNDSLWLPWVMNRTSNRKMVSLTKSASYLMHTVFFSKVRSFILQHSAVHVQDDTGISYKDIVAFGKAVKLYGKYTRVIPLFKNHFQKDLYERYRSDSIPPLPFKIGYNLPYQESSIQVLK